MIKSIIMANLFGKNRLCELAHQVKTEDIQDYIVIVKTWHNDYHKGSLKADKETSREQAYNQDFFIKILGYQEKPASPYSLEPKATTEKGQLPDAVLSYSDTEKDIKNIAAVVELKGASIELDRPQRRDGNMSPVQQGFKYKTQYRNCPFVVVSNFWEFRLYRDNLLDYEVWTLDDLINPDGDYILFKTWYVLLNRDNFTVSSGASKTEVLLSDIRIEQEEIGKKFYKVYRDARLELLRDIYKNNPDVKKDIDFGIEKAQKIIDRIVFACFAEDKGLLPDNTLHRVVKAAEGSAFGGSLWSTLKSFFEAVDSGSEKLEIPQGYNGGLFRNDDDLNNLQISDEPLRSVLSLSTYNFDEDLSVTILGHIFEQSISDLEEIKNKVKESQNLETLSQSRRKKDGIFYTPDYIVHYIVDNSLGIYLREYEEKFKEEFGLKGDINDVNYEKRERQVYEKYQVFLQDIKVLDPACGSGAFLVYVFDYLMTENKRVSSILGGGLFSNDLYIRSILKNNIFGVDLNEESVEITKLSLWLKSAEKGKKLTSLDKNIKCGNSLIDDPEIAGNKAFDWDKEFPEIMKSGGFDVVVGNPPYVSAMDLKKVSSSEEHSFLKQHYVTAVGSVDLYIYFFEKGVLLLKNEGYLSFISPNRYLSASYGKTLREWFINNFTIVSLVDYSNTKVFSDASTYPVITFVKKTKPEEEYVVRTGKIDPDSKQAILSEFSSNKLSLLDDSILGFLLNDKIYITEKIFSKSVSLQDAGKINATSTAKEADEYSVLINDSSGTKIVNTGTIDPYTDLWGMRRLVNKGNKYTSPYLEINERIISENRRNLYSSPKIIIAKIGLKCESFYDRNGDFASINTNCIHSFSDDFDPDYIQCWISSKLYNYVFECLFDGLRMAGGYLLFSAPNLKNTPIKLVDKKLQQPFVVLSEDMSSLNSSLNNSNSRFRKLICSEFTVEKWPTKLNKWWQLEFDKFISTLKIELSLQQKDELLSLFEKYKKECSVYNNRIIETEDEINQLVYKLYELTPEEVKIIESA
jgi:type I restriction-modification system DNA methylase subunit